MLVYLLSEGPRFPAGIEQTITGCCTPKAKPGRPASDTGADTLIKNIFTYLAWYGLKVSAWRL